MNTPTLPSFHLSAAPTNVFMVDIETAGTKYGSAITEIAAAEFNPQTAEILREWSTAVSLMDCIRSGLRADDPATAGFHRRNGTEPGPGCDLWRALNTLDTFLHLHSEEIVVWAWGIDFEVKHFEAAGAAVSMPMPWRYWQGQCARTVWNVAFPGVKHSPRPHRADLDVRMQVQDLAAALAALKGKEAAA